MAVLSSPSSDAAAMRQSMVVSQLRTNGVNQAPLIAAMSAIAREDFLPAEHRALAYRDQLLPLGGGRFQNLPLATARLIGALDVAASDHVLLIGAAGGYAAAILARLGATVVAVEDFEPSLAIARGALAGIGGVTLVQAPLTAGAPDHGPFDAIMIDGAVESVPQAIIDQLKPGGRLATGLVDAGVTRLAAGHRSPGGFGLIDFLDVECAVLPGFGRPRGFVF